MEPVSTTENKTVIPPSFKSIWAMDMRLETSAYRERQPYTKALLRMCKPNNIVFIKFGTNDAGVRNNEFRHAFNEDYRKVVDTYRKLPSKPRVILLTPIRSFLPEYHPDDVIVKEIIPIINQVAQEYNLELINLHDLYGDKWKEHLMPDKLHPSSIGAGNIALRLYQHLTKHVSTLTNFKNRDYFLSLYPN